MTSAIKNNRQSLFYALLLTLLFTSFQSITYAQNSQEFKGKVIDTDSNKALALADLLVIGTNISTITNSEGEFILKVPNKHLDKAVLVSYLGYKKLQIPLITLKKRNTKIKLIIAATVLAQVDINAPKDAETLVKKTLNLKADNYLNTETVMTSFYRETIKKRNKNASLSEAVLKIYKYPYVSNRKDAIKLIKARKNTDYSRLDTLALKLQGGPFSTLHTDIIKYPEYIFNADDIDDYTFSFNKSTQINNKLIFVVHFKQKDNITRPMYFGKLYIDAENYALTSAVYNLNVSNRKQASKLFVKKKPRKATVYPTRASYRVNYRVKNGKWHFGYSNIELSFKVKWDNKLFNSRYTLQSEMAITDWDKNTSTFVNKPKNRLKPNTILADEASGFADPEFWGEYNIIEPEKSIESAIKKISKQLKKS
ncbi:carboxypeptidase-like regulatory domain-containing protein [Lacinutrix jangbogonensis]|uniref:carboxypeptidase-like regulatory domain-containing protein n=1 Tax=Lacinutrix jangbogonensis TaxID=1469557 RepID=UPI00053E04D1|nr:carboxypeptidase-like regulatory domain-containing protein [Lacinutrix jangbogonensis]